MKTRLTGSAGRLMAGFVHGRRYWVAGTVPARHPAPKPCCLRHTEDECGLAAVCGSLALYCSWLLLVLLVLEVLGFLLSMGIATLYDGAPWGLSCPAACACWRRAYMEFERSSKMCWTVRKRLLNGSFWTMCHTVSLPNSFGSAKTASLEGMVLLMNGSSTSSHK